MIPPKDVLNAQLSFIEQAKPPEPPVIEPAEPTLPLFKLPRPAEYITSNDQAKAAVQSLLSESLLGIDSETTYKIGCESVEKAGLNPRAARVRLVQVATAAGRTFVFDLFRIEPTLLNPLTAVAWVAANHTFDYSMLKSTGIETSKHFYCSHLAGRLAHTTRRVESLATGVERTLGQTLPKEEQLSDWSAPELTAQQIEYAAADALACLQIYQKLLPTIIEQGQHRIYTLWCRTALILADASLTGFRFDWAAHQALSDSWDIEKQKQAELLQPLMPGVNPDSNKQLGEWLAEHCPGLHIEWPKTDADAPSFTKETLPPHSNLSWCAALLDYRKAGQLVKSFGNGSERVQPKRESTPRRPRISYRDKYGDPVSNRIHPQFRHGMTVTGRLTCSNPNLQQVPRGDMRNLFVADDGCVLVGADLGQVELRVAALISKDKTMLAAYRDGKDLHRITAAAMVGISEDAVTPDQRQAAKAVNFGLLFGAGYKGLRDYARNTYGVDMSLAEAAKHRLTFLQTYSQYAKWQRQQADSAEETGKATTRLSLLRDWVTQGGNSRYTESMNIPIQGSAAEVMLETIDRLPEQLPAGAQILHTVHDELIIQCQIADADQVKQTLIDCFRQGFLAVFPEADALGLAGADLVDAATGRSWGEIH